MRFSTLSQQKRALIIRCLVALSLIAYPLWWMYPLFAQTTEARLGTRLSDTYGIVVVADGFKRGWSSFLHYGSDFFPDGKSFVNLEWISQLIPHSFTWVAAQFMDPIDVLHSLILVGWTFTGYVIYWALTRFGIPTIAATIGGVVVQMMPALRWFAMNHIAYMFLAVALIPAALIMRTLFVHKGAGRKPLFTAIGTLVILVFLDGYIAYFAVLLTVIALILSATLRWRSSPLESAIISAVGATVLLGTLIAGKFVAASSPTDSSKSFRGYVTAIVSDINALIDPTYDIGFGNLSPYIGLPLIVLLVCGLVANRKHRFHLTIGTLFLTASAFALSIDGFRFSLAAGVLEKLVPRFRYYDRFSVLAAMVLTSLSVALIFGAPCVRSSRRAQLASCLIVFSVALISFKPHAMRSVVDESVYVDPLVTSLDANRDVVLRIGAPPLFPGVRFASFRSAWDERFALSRGNAHLRDVACASGANYLLVNGALDVFWQGNQYMSAYEVKEWVNLDDERYFRLRSVSWWDDHSSKSVFDRRQLRLFELRSCQRPRVPVDVLAAPVEVMNDGVVMRQIRPDEFNSLNFAVSPQVAIQPRFAGDYQKETLAWTFVVGISDGYSQKDLSFTVTNSGSLSATSQLLRQGQTQLIMVQTQHPHHVRIETEQRNGETFYFSIGKFAVNPIPIHPQN